MTQRTLKLAGVLAAFLGAAAALGQSRDGLLKVESFVSPLRLARGEAGKVVFRVKVKDGLTISPLPSFIIEFAPNDELVFSKPFYTASDLGVEIQDGDKGKDALSFKKEIAIPFMVNPKAARGVHVLNGRIKFFAISKGEGWCLKSTAKFSATYSTRTAVPRREF
jgi:hypothetical protein